MIQIDISNIWGQVSLQELLSIEKETAQAHQTLTDGTGKGGTFRGWLKLPLREKPEELERIQAAAEQIRSDSEVCVIVGVWAGARAAIELLRGAGYPEGPRLLYAENALSTRSWNALTRQLEGKDFSVIVVSKTGQEMEPAIAFRGLKWMLERRYGTEEANNRIYAVTDPEDGALRQMVREQSWQSFGLPEDVPEEYSALTAAGLLPMAVAGIDIEAVLAGAEEAREAYDLRSFENPVWLYGAVRTLMHRQGMTAELLGSFEPDFRGFGNWWQQLFSGEEGLIPVPCQLPGELFSLGQLLRQGRCLETLIRFEAPELPHRVGFAVQDLDGVNDLAGKTLEELQEQAFFAAVEAHTDGGVPVMILECGALTEETVGQLLYFFQLSCALSACLMEADPFARQGMAAYRENLNRLLGRPQPEVER